MFGKLKEGPLVKWLGEDGGHQVGCLMVDPDDDDVISYWGGAIDPCDASSEPVLCRVWPTGELVFVEHDLLQPREVRKD